MPSEWGEGYGTIVKWKYSHGKGSVITVAEYNETGRNGCLDGVSARSMSRFQSRASLLLPVFLYPLQFLSLSLSFFLSSRDFSFRQLRHAYHAQDTSGENKLGLFIGLIKKIKQKKRKAWLRGRLKIKTTILFARWIYFFHRFQLYTGSPNFTFRFFPNSFLPFLSLPPPSYFA